MFKGKEGKHTVLRIEDTGQVVSHDSVKTRNCRGFFIVLHRLIVECEILLTLSRRKVYKFSI